EAAGPGLDGRATDGHAQRDEAEPQHGAGQRRHQSPEDAHRPPPTRTSVPRRPPYHRSGAATTPRQAPPRLQCPRPRGPAPAVLVAREDAIMTAHVSDIGAYRDGGTIEFRLTGTAIDGL